MQGLFFRDRVVFLGVPSIHLVNGIPGRTTLILDTHANAALIELARQREKPLVHALPQRAQFLPHGFGGARVHVVA